MRSSKPFCISAIYPRVRRYAHRLLSLVEPNRPQYIATARRRYEGLIEGIRDGQLYGWCWLTQTHDPVSLDVLVDDRFVMRVVGDTFRQDLLDAHVGTGGHGFFIPVEALHAKPELSGPRVGRRIWHRTE